MKPKSTSLTGAETGRRKARWPSRLIARLTAALVVAGLGSGLAPTVEAAAQPGPAADGMSAGQRLQWEPCPIEELPVECADFAVPTDHGDPAGPTMLLQVRRLRAPRGARSAGSVILNPGGPGVSPSAMLVGVARGGLFADWDLVAPDPRGVGGSRSLRCGTPAPLAADPFDLFDAHAAQIGALAASCLEEDSFFLQIGSENVARDLDLLRDALGEEQLNFYGASYGTHLAGVYATVFPDRVGRFVLDGPVLLDDRTRSFTEQIRGFGASIRRIDAACAATEDCALRPYGLRSVWRHLRWRLGNGEKIVGAIDRDAMVEADLGSFHAATSLALYVGRSSWSAFASALLAAMNGDGAPLVALERAWAGDGTGSSLLARTAVLCADDARRASPQMARQLASEEIARGNDVFARDLGPLIGSCAEVPTAPIATPTIRVADSATPTALVFAGAHDPVTPLAGALRFVDQYRPTRLVVVDDDGHTSVGRGHRCVDRLVTAYLADGSLPDRGTVCRPNRGHLGIVVTATRGPTGGRLVQRVAPGAAAEGLIELGDEILSVNDAPLAFVEAGESYRVELVRSGRRLTVTVIAGPPAYWLPSGDGELVSSPG